MDADLRDMLAAVEDHHWWFEGRRRILYGVLRGLALPPDARILEVGCGSGGNLPLLARFGSVHAVEPDTAARERAAKRGLGPVEPGALPHDLPFAGETFDLVALLDVLEHVDDHQAAVHAMHDRVAPGGFLVVTVPAHPWLWSAHDERNHHRRRYRRSALRAVLSGAGLDVAGLTYFNALLSPVAVALRLLGAGSAGADLPPAPINRILTAVMGSEAGAVARYRVPFGLSLLALARRPGTAARSSRSAPEPGRRPA